MDIILDGEHAKDYGLQLAARPPIPIANPEYETIQVPGRHAPLTREIGYKPVEVPHSFNYIDTAEPSAKKRARAARNWLTGKRKLEYTDAPGFYYLIQQINAEEITNDLPQYASFTVTFTLEPFEYEDAGIKTLEGHGKVTNPSSISVQPIIHLYGNGQDARLTVSGQDVIIRNLTDSITLNGIAEQATKNGENMNREMIGKFPVLEPGENTVSFTSNIERVEIERRWAWR